jgi:ATP-binding cassette subfamily B protein
MAAHLGAKQIPYVQQLSATECGAACLSMVLRFHGRAVRTDELRNLVVGARDATNAQALLDVAKRYGLRGRAVTLDTDQLKYLDRSAILHWEFNHFVVFDRARRDRVLVVDPRRGHSWVSMRAFNEAFTGVALIFEPTTDFRKQKDTRRPLRFYVRQILSERGFLPHILLTSVLIQAFGLALPLFTRALIDSVIPYRAYDLLLVLGLGLMAVTACQSLTGIVRTYLLLYLRTRLSVRVTVGFFDHMLALPFDFFQRRSTGDLLVRLGSNSSVKDTVTGAILSTVLDGTVATGYLAALLIMSPSMAIAAMCLAATHIAVFLVTRHKQRQFIVEALDTQSRSQGYIVEILSAIETLKSMGAEGRAVAKWTGLFASELNVGLRKAKLDAQLEAVGSIVRTSSSVGLLAVGALQVLAGSLTLGDMMALTAIANGFIGPMISLVSTGAKLQLVGVSLERLYDVLETPSERDQSGAQRRITITGQIALSDVTFRYGPTSTMAVRRTSLTINAGEFVAIVGRSGAGKSTLARLLVGLYAPTEGQVLYDGMNLAELDLEAVRRQIGVVTQQAQLFGGTIRSNISLLEPELEHSEIERAARLAGVHDEILAMPMGYDTVLADRGTSLSGGQQQRLSLARALALRPHILVLDEATNQLDVLTEQGIQARLAELSCTRIVVAHRLSTVRHADRILVMDSGHIVESGNHTTLISMNGLYTRLLAAQADRASVQTSEPDLRQSNPRLGAEYSS